MKPYLSIIQDSFYEAKATKAFHFLIIGGILSGAGLFWYALTSDVASINELKNSTINFCSKSICMIISICIAGGFSLKTFEQGSIDLLLSKPISRSGLFIAKFLWGLIFYSIQITTILVGIYLILGVTKSIWDINLLKCIFINIFLFIICYSVWVLIGLISRNLTISIIVTLMFLFSSYLLGDYIFHVERQHKTDKKIIEQKHTQDIISNKEKPKLYSYVAYPLYKVLPKPYVLDNVAKYFLADNEDDKERFKKIVMKQSNYPLLESVLFIGGMLFLGCMYISYKDY